MSVMDDVVNAQDAARHIGVSRSLIDYWRGRGLLKPIGRHGRSLLYRLGDVIDLDVVMRDTPQSRRAA